MTEWFLLLGNICFYLIWQNIQLKRFWFFYVKEINSPEKEKKKRLNGQYLFFLPGNHFTQFHKWEKKEQSPVRNTGEKQGTII